MRAVPRGDAGGEGGARKTGWWGWKGLVLGLVGMGMVGLGWAAPQGSGAAGQNAAGQNVAALLAVTDELAKQVATLRGLPQKAPIKRGVLSREQIVEKLKARIAQEYTPAQVRNETGVLRRLGLLPMDVDYEQAIYALLGDQVAGFYDPYEGMLYIADWLPVELQRPALAHEIEHALQDQHFDLKKLAAPLPEDGDRQLARSALAEGDGMAVMLALAAGMNGGQGVRLSDFEGGLGRQRIELTMAASPVFQRTPRVLRETLVFPYATGLDFVLAQRGQTSWALVDAMFRNPPESTEQILHPEKYRSHERPIKITAAPLSSLAPLKETHRDVMGEHLLGIWFDSQLLAAHAVEAASGWGGDRLVAYGGQGAELPVVVVLSAWDSETDTDQAEQHGRRLILDMLKIKEKDQGPKLPRGVPLFRTRGNEAFGVARRGRLVAWVLGAPKGSEQAVLNEVFATFQVEWPPQAVVPPPQIERPPLRPGML